MLSEPTSAVNGGLNNKFPFGIKDKQLGGEMPPSTDAAVPPEQGQDAPDPAWERWSLLKNRLADEMSRGFSIARIATETRLRAEVIDAWSKNFEYFRESHRIGSDSEARRIEATLEARFNELDQERTEENKKSPERIITSVTQKVMEGISMARDMTQIVDISAPPGSGKSQGVAEYLARSRKAEGFDCPVWPIELSEFSLSKKSVLHMIARTCISANYNQHDETLIAQEIADRTQGRKGVLIIEEAQHLADEKKKGITIFNGLRRFVDANCFGIVLIGNGELYKSLKSGQHAQLLSRMSSFRMEIQGVIDEDVDRIMAEWGVSGKAERALCLKIASGPGALRSLVFMFQRSLRDYGVVSLATLNKVPRV